MPFVERPAAGCKARFTGLYGGGNGLRAFGALPTFRRVSQDTAQRPQVARADPKAAQFSSRDCDQPDAGTAAPVPRAQYFARSHATRCARAWWRRYGGLP